MALGTEGLCPLAEGRRPISSAPAQRRSADANDSNTHEATNGEGWIEHTQSGTLEEGQNRVGGCIIKAKDGRAAEPRPGCLSRP